MTQAPGRRLLKVAGILYIILGGLGMALTLQMAWGAGSTNSAHEAALLVQSGLFLLTGMVGIKYCGAASEAGLLKRFAAVNIALAVAMSVFTFVILPQFFTALYELSSGLALGVIYLIGASKNEAVNLEV